MSIFHSVVNLSLVLVLTGQALSIRSSQRQDSGQSPGTHGQTAGANNIRESWEKQYKRLNKRSKDYPNAKLNILLKLLKKASPEVVKEEFERCTTLLTSYAELSEYDKTLVQAFTVRLIGQNDRDNLVHLLSLKCPRFVSDLPLEQFLALNVTDGVLILFDSYETVNGDSRKTLLEALKRAFRVWHTMFRNENTFLNRSKEWYMSHRSEVKVNPLYKPYSMSSSYHELFIPKTSHGQKKSNKKRYWRAGLS